MPNPQELVLGVVVLGTQVVVGTGWRQLELRLQERSMVEDRARHSQPGVVALLGPLGQQLGVAPPA